MWAWVKEISPWSSKIRNWPVGGQGGICSKSLCLFGFKTRIFHYIIFRAGTLIVFALSVNCAFHSLRLQLKYGRTNPAEIECPYEPCSRGKDNKKSLYFFVLAHETRYGLSSVKQMPVFCPYRVSLSYWDQNFHPTYLNPLKMMIMQWNLATRNIKFFDIFEIWFRIRYIWILPYIEALFSCLVNHEILSSRKTYLWRDTRMEVQFI